MRPRAVCPPRAPGALCGGRGVQARSSGGRRGAAYLHLAEVQLCVQRVHLLRALHLVGTLVAGLHQLRAAPRAAGELPPRRPAPPPPSRPPSAPSQGKPRPRASVSPSVLEELGLDPPPLTLLMAFSARLAALCLSGWPWALRQSVCRDDARREPRQGPVCTPGFEARMGRGPSPTPDPGGAAARLRLDPRGLCRARLVGGNRERAAPRALPLPVLGHLCPAREGPAASSSTPPRGPRRVRCPFWLGQLTHPAQATCCLRELSGASPRVCTCVCV